MGSDPEYGRAELTARLADPAAPTLREMHLVKSLLREDEVDALRARFEALRVRDDDASTAAEPTAHARILVEDGRVVCPELHALLSPALAGRILPWVRHRLGDDSVVLADALMRAYRHDDRRQALAPHFDVTSYATVIVPLNPGEYAGGLYVQPGADAATRVLVDASFDKGDALLHRFDLMHGVEVTRGDRYSLVLWLSQAGVAPEAAPWLGAAARAGNIYAQFLYAEARKSGCWGWAADLAEAAEYQRRAARAGHALSQHQLGFMHKTGRGVAKSDARCRELWTAAAEAGHAGAQANLARQFARGGLGLEPDLSEALRWYRKAARQGDAEAAAELSHFLQLQAGGLAD